MITCPKHPMMVYAAELLRCPSCAAEDESLPLEHRLRGSLGFGGGLHNKAADEIERLRTYAVQLAGALLDDALTREIAMQVRAYKPINEANVRELLDDIRQGIGIYLEEHGLAEKVAALAKNPLKETACPFAGCPFGDRCLHAKNPNPSPTPDPCTNAEAAEVRLDSDGNLDEVVASGAAMESLDFNHWFIEIGDVAVWLHAKGRINATYERRAQPALGSLSSPQTGAHPERHETWPQGDPYPWIVREPSGQCWGPFATNKAASQWADDNKIDTCDFEDVMPPPELRHQSGQQDPRRFTLTEKRAPSQTDVDYAVEHAGYLATAAQSLLATCGARDLACQELEEVEESADCSSGARLAMERANESYGDALHAMRDAIYEFEKRRDRALQSVACTKQEADRG